GTEIDNRKKSEGRMTKPERNRKAEFRNPLLWLFFRISSFDLLSAFGFRHSDFRLLSLVVLLSPVLVAGAADQSLATNGWQPEAPRDEIRPAFEYKQAGGPGGHDTLAIRADGR